LYTALIGAIKVGLSSVKILYDWVLTSPYAKSKKSRDGLPLDQWLITKMAEPAMHHGNMEIIEWILEVDLPEEVASTRNMSIIRAMIIGDDTTQFVTLVDRYPGFRFINTRLV